MNCAVSFYDLGRLRNIVSIVTVYQSFSSEDRQHVSILLYDLTHDVIENAFSDEIAAIGDRWLRRGIVGNNDSFTWPLIIIASPDEYTFVVHQETRSGSEMLISAH